MLLNSFGVTCKLRTERSRHRKSSTKLIAAAVSAAAIGMMSAAPVFAAQQTWTGATNTDFENPGNWSTAVPANDLTTDIGLFSGAVTTNQPALSISRSINGLQFTTATGGWDLGGGALVLSLGSSGISTVGQTSGIDTIDTALSLGAAQTWSVGAGGTLVINTAIGGAAGNNLTIGTSGNTGTLVLNGNSNYLGTTTIAFGTVQLGNANALGSNAATSGTSINSGATLDLNGQTISETISAISGTGVGANGALINSNTTTAASITSAISGNQSFTIGGAGNITLAQIVGTAAFTDTKIGTGTLTLGGTLDNSFLTLNANAGTVLLSKTSTATVHAVNSLVIGGALVQVGAASAFQVNALTVNTGTFDLNASSQTMNTLASTVTTGTVENNGTGTATLTIGGASSSSSYAGLIVDNTNAGAGKVALTKVGTGTLTLTNTDTYTGATTVTGGLTLSGPNGSINTAGLTTLLSGTLLLDNTGAAANNNNNRLNDASDLAFSNSTLTYKGATAAGTNSSETVGNLIINTGGSTLSMVVGGTNSATLNATSLTRSAGGTAFVNGLNLGEDSSTTTSIARINLTNAPTLVGATDALSTGINGAAQNTKIVPFLTGEAATGSGGTGTATGSPNTFVTYNPGTGLRPLNPTDEFTQNALVTGNNTRINSTTVSTANATINSLLISGGNLTLTDGTNVRTSSGAILFSSTNAIAPSNTIPSAAPASLEFGSNEGIFSVAPTFTGTVSTVINGAGGISKSGGGTLALSAANPYTGTTYLNGGVLSVSGGNALPDFQPLVIGNIAGASLTLASTETVGSLSGGGSIGGNVTLGANTLAVNQVTAGTYSGVISGTGSLVKESAAALTLAGANTFTGLVNINGGNLALNGGAAIADSTPINFANFSGAGLIVNSSETVGNISGGGPQGGGINITSGQTFTVNVAAGTTTNYAGTISGSGAFTRANAGNNTTFANLILSGVNTFTGGVSITDSVLTITNSAALGTTTKTISITNGTAGAPELHLDGSGGSIALPGALSFNTSYNGAGPNGGGSIVNVAGINSVAGTITLQSGGGATALVSNAGTLTLSGGISAGTTGRAVMFRGDGNGVASGVIADGSTPALPVSKDLGAGTWTFSNAANTYTGVTTVSAGTLAVTKLANINTASSIGKGSAAGSAADLVINGATFQYVGTTASTTNRLFTIGTAGATLDASGTAAANTVGFTGPGSIVLSGTNAARTISLTGINAGANVLGLILGNNGTGLTSLTKTGIGSWSLTGANTFTGATTVNGGTLKLDYTGTNTGFSIISSASRLQVGAGIFAVNGTAVASQTTSQTVNGLTVAAGGSGIAAVSNGGDSVSLTLGAITRNTGGTVDFTLPSAGGVFTTSGTAGTLLTDSLGDAYATVGGADWAAKDASNATIVGLSTIGGYTPSTANSLSGNADVTTGTDTTLTSNTAISSLRVNVPEARTIDIGGNTLATGGVLVTSAVGSHATTITDGTFQGSAGGDLTIFQNNTGGALTIAATILDNSSPTALTKSGAGTLILAASNNGYTGPTTVNTGTLQIGNGGANGSLGGSAAITGALGTALSFNSTSSIAVNNPIGGGLALSQVGTGSTKLNAASTYTGGTSITAGSLIASADNSLPPNMPLTITGVGSNLTSLNIQGNQATGAISILGTGSNNAITIAAGKTLTVTGTDGTTTATDFNSTNNVFRVGGNTTSATATTTATISGAGTLTINNSLANFALDNVFTAASTTTTLDMHALSTFNATINELRLGYGQFGTGVLTLAVANTITANTIYVGNSQGSNPGNGTTSLTLGTTNTLNVNSINVGYNKDIGQMTFIASATNPTLVIRGTAGGTSGAFLTIGVNNTGTASNVVGNVLLDAGTGRSDGSVDAILSTLKLGEGATGTSTGNGTGTFEFDLGTVNAANIILGSSVSGNTSTTATGTGTLNQKGGTLLAGNMTLAAKAGTPAAAGTYNLTGGSAVFSGDIASGGGTSTIVLSNATLDLGGHTIGGAVGSGAAPITTLTLQSGTIQNVGEINAGVGFGLTKTTAGTLTLAGFNSYTAPTNANAGILLVTGAVANSVVSINAGGTLQGTGVIRGPVTVKQSGTISAGTPTATGNLSTLGGDGVTTFGQTWTGGSPDGSTGGAYTWKLNVNNVGPNSDGTLNNDKTGANWDQLSISTLSIAATSANEFNIRIVSLSGTGSNSFDPTKTYAWTAANVASGTISNFDPTAFHVDSSGFVNPNPQLGSLGSFSVTTAMDGSLDDVVIDYSPAPEPTSLALFAVGAGGLLMRRRRKARAV